MKVCEAWLREWVNPALTGQQLAEQLTMAGLEVDALNPIATHSVAISPIATKPIEIKPSDITKKEAAPKKGSPLKGFLERKKKPKEHIAYIQ